MKRKKTISPEVLANIEKLLKPAPAEEESNEPPYQEPDPQEKLPEEKYSLEKLLGKKPPQEKPPQEKPPEEKYSLEKLLEKKPPQEKPPQEKLPQEKLPEENSSQEKPLEEKSPEEKPPKKSAQKALINLLIKLSLILLVIWLALIFVFGVFRMEGNNMYPMLKDGDLCVTYKLEEYHSTDVVVYRVGKEIRFGRIIARAGDKVDGDSTGLLINGGRPSEEIFYPTQMWDINLALPVVLNEGEFMILNDYREDLKDSRSYGIINEDDLEGKIVFIFRRRGF